MRPAILTLCVLLCLPVPAAGQGLFALGGDEGIGLALAEDEDANLVVELSAVEQEFSSRLERQDSLLQWRLQRLDRTRDELSRDLTELLEQRGSTRRSSDAGRLLTRLIAQRDELDSILRELQDRLDEEADVLQRGISTSRQLRMEVEGPQIERLPESRLVEHLNGLTERLLAANHKAVEIERQIERARKAEEKAQAEADALREALYIEAEAEELPEPYPLLDDEGSPVLDEAGLPVVVTPTPRPVSRKEQAERQLEDQLARYRLRAAERTAQLHGRERAALAHELEIAQLHDPVLRRLIGRVEERQGQVSQRQGEGVLAVGPGLIRREAIDGAVDHARALLARPAQTLAAVRERVEQSRRGQRRTSMAVYLALVLLGVATAWPVPRIQRQLAAWRADTWLDALLKQALVPALPLLPVSIVNAALAVLGLVPPVIEPLYVFSAVAPLSAAIAMGLLDAILPAQGTETLTRPVARYLRAVVRFAVLVACLLQFVIVLLPLFDFPRSAVTLGRSLMLGWLLLGWLALALRKGEMLRLLGIADEQADNDPDVLRRGIRRFYRVFALGPLLVYGLHAVGYSNLAELIVRGGSTTLGVLLIAPWVHLRLRGVVEFLVGYPNGGGVLVVSPEASRTIFQAFAPVLWFVVGLGSLTLIASGWDYQGNVLSNLVLAVNTPFIVAGNSEISLAGLMLLGVTLAATATVVGMVSRWLREQLIVVYDLDTGSAYAVEILVRYVLYAAGFLSALVVAGVGVGVLAVFGSVIGIGVGFGSQQVAANFLSGTMLLLTRRVSIGDVVEVDGVVGRVTSIASLATSLRTLDNLVVIVPNATLIDSKVINWSLEESSVRLNVAVGVAYGSPVKRVQELLLRACLTCPKVLNSPPPSVRFDDFGDSALIFTALPWIADPDDRFVVASDLRKRIDAAFREGGIEIAFPQVDLHVRAGDGTLKVAMENGFEVRDAEGQVLAPARSAG